MSQSEHLSAPGVSFVSFAENGVSEMSSKAGSYTVDFCFTGEDGTETEFHLTGGSEIMLSELFEKLGIRPDIADIFLSIPPPQILLSVVK